MDKTLDSEYLNRPLISNVNYIVTDMLISVSNENTSFLRYEKAPKLIQSEILDNYSQLIKLCRSEKIKIKYSIKCKKKLNEIWESYITQKAEEKFLFENLVQKVKQLESRGLHKGTSDDFVLLDCEKIAEQLLSFYWRTSAISQVHEIDRHIKNLLKDITRQDKITIYGQIEYICL